MSKRKKLLLTIGGSIAGLLIVLLVAAMITVQTAWFVNFVRQKIIASVEDSTGGVVEIGAFEFDLRHFTVRIRNFVLHGTEPRGSDPLARVRLLELRLKLFSGLKKTVDLAYLGIEHPQVNLMLLPDGTTNIPQPKVPTKPSQTSGLQTVVDLAVNKFQLDDGLLKVLQDKTGFSGRGENLRVLLNYNALNPSYVGNLAMDPLIITSGKKPPINVHVNVPITLERDAIRVADAKLSTERSQALLSGSMVNLNEPVITARLNASVSLPEIQRSIDVPIDANVKGAPKELKADLALSMNVNTNAIQIQTAHLGLGQTTFQGSGDVSSGKQGGIQFNANLALGELSKLLNISGFAAGGELQANGRATLDNPNNYAVDGTFNSRALSLRSGTTHVSDVGLYSPFHVDPYLISMDGLKLTALGGSLAAKVFVEKLQDVSVEGRLRNLSIPTLAQVFTGKRLGYDGVLDGSVVAKGNLKAKGTTGYTAQANLDIVPGRHGIPLSGKLNANYSGAPATLDLGNSYLALPNSRIDLRGSLNREIELKLLSRNLNDFLPAIDFGAAKPMTSLPVVLRNGTAMIQARINGNTAAPHIAAHIDVSDFAVEQHPFTHLAADVSASPSQAILQHGLLTAKGFDSDFDASMGLSKWAPKPASPVTANLDIKNGNLADLASLAGEASLQASGSLTAGVHVNGTYGNPLGSADLQVSDGSVYQQPFSKFNASVNLADQLITLSRLELDAAGGTLSADGTFQHPRDSFTVGRAQMHLATNQVQLAKIEALVKQNAGVAGVVQLNANATADIQSVKEQMAVQISNITADLSARNLQVQNQAAGSLTASAKTSAGKVSYTIHSDFAGSDIKVNGQTTLAKDYFTTADASVANLPVAKALQLAGRGAIPARGDLSATAHVNGTLDAPNADLTFALNRANVYQEPINSLRGQVRYSKQSIDIPALELNVPAGSLSLSGAFDHPANDLNAGSLNLKLSSSDIQVAQIEHVQEQKPGLAGTLRLAANLSGNLREEHGKSVMLISNLNADAYASALHLNKTSLGGINFTARTTGSNLNFRLDSDFAKSQVHGTGRAQLTGDYPMTAALSFTNIRYSNLVPLLPSQTAGPVPYDALVEGEASMNGPILNPGALAGRLQLNRLDLSTNSAVSATGSPTLRSVELQNQGPIVVSLKSDVVQIEQFHFGGRDTSLNASGRINLRDSQSPLAVDLDANVNLGLLQDADRDFYSSGSLAMNASIRGSFAQPRANGQIELKNANVNYADAPIGLSNANGLILLNGTNATIQSLTGESGGGRVALTGFVGLGTGIPTFNLRAAATKVRVRYSGISATSNAAIALAGTLKRSLLSGSVTVERVAYASSSDAGSLLSTASTPPSIPSSPSPLLSGMRLDIRVLTAPDIEVVSTYANRLSVLANLAVRGTAESPGMLGRVNVTDGQLVFFGNTYTVTAGTINFYDPTTITPVLNISLDTIAQGVDVTIGVTGPMNDLKLNYRSDPPLTFEQIVQLLATNTTPANPVIAAHQPSPPQQSLSQMGESAVLGQAVANPLASRVQRVFGLSQFKIDPSVGGSNGPSARITLQEKIASNITFTYINDVTQPNAQIVRVQWDLTSNLSAVGLRDYNGNVSVQLLYKFTRR
ncbi:MAG: translocation/assembly module TamB domain-containing protein [Acidobacteriota bacterium]|nr:translocation/assembly module TamB domain-containing protein [Acidobacteriota bacterium]